MLRAESPASTNSRASVAPQLLGLGPAVVTLLGDGVPLGFAALLGRSSVLTR